MARSVKKGPFVQEALVKKVESQNAAGSKKVIKTWSRLGHSVGQADQG